MDKVKLLMDRTATGLKEKIGRAIDEGYRPEGSFNRTSDGRWFMQTMVPDEKPPAEAPKKSKASKEPKPDRAKKAAKK